MNIILSQFLYCFSSFIMNASLIKLGMLIGPVYRLVIQSGRVMSSYPLEIYLKWNSVEIEALIGYFIILLGILTYTGVHKKLKPKKIQETEPHETEPHETEPHETEQQETDPQSKV